MSGPIEAPVLFIVFNRPETTAQVFNAIRQARPRRLYIAADGPRPGREGEVERTCQVREVVSAVDWPCETQHMFRDENVGCRRGVSGAIGWLFEHEDRGIILEDDCLPAQSFFKYCEELLEKYRLDERIWDIAGSNSLGKPNWECTTSYLYSGYGEIWGWATWRDRWQSYDLELKDAKATGEFDSVLENLQPWEFPEVRRRQFESILDGFDTWDYQWLFNRMSHSGLSVVPAENMVSNIGFGPEGTHTRQPNQYANRPATEIEFPLVSPPAMVRDIQRDRAFLQQAFAHHRRNGLQRFISRIRQKISNH